MSQQESWHLSKSVPISLIFGLITQGAAIIWTVSMMMSDIESNRTDLIRLETRTDKIEEVVQGQAVTLGRMDENLKSIRIILEGMARQK